METERKVIIKLANKQKNQKHSKLKKLKYLIFFFFFLFVLIIIGIIIFIYIYKLNLNQNNFSKLSIEKLYQISSTILKLIKLKEEELKNLLYFNNNINEKYKHELNYFCDNQNIYYNKEFEDKIKKIDVDLNEKKFYLFAYDNSDAVSNKIYSSKSWEEKQTNLLLNALNFYSNKKNIKNENIYFVDIGANIGWYSFFLGKYGYNIISFEPNKLNYYILKKNFCLNKDIKITIINKGLYSEEKKCDLHLQIGNVGNGMAICDNQGNILPHFLQKNKTEEIILTKLNNYIPFLSEKNLALIKIDAEGSEGKVFEGGIELITKYHVPFIFIEFAPKSLELHGTKPREFLQLLKDNGYNFSLESFFDKNIFTPDDIIKRTNDYINLYIFYTQFIE